MAAKNRNYAADEEMQHRSRPRMRSFEKYVSLRRLIERRAVVAEQAQHFVGGVGEVGAGAEDRLHARGAERGIILRRDDPARRPP